MFIVNTKWYKALSPIFLCSNIPDCRKTMTTNATSSSTTSYAFPWVSELVLVTHTWTLTQLDIRTISHSTVSITISNPLLPHPMACPMLLIIIIIILEVVQNCFCLPPTLTLQLPLPPWPQPQHRVLFSTWLQQSAIQIFLQRTTWLWQMLLLKSILLMQSMVRKGQGGRRFWKLSGPRNSSWRTRRRQSSTRCSHCSSTTR